MATFTEALVVQIRGDSGHLLAELQRSRAALAKLRREFEAVDRQRAQRTRSLGRVPTLGAAAPPGAGARGIASVEAALSAQQRFPRAGLGIPSPPVRRASGGVVRGRPGPDRVPALLTSGEFVMSREAVARMGLRFMEAINARRFQSGGSVERARSLAPAARFAGTQAERLRLLGLAALPRLLDRAVRLFDRGLQTGDPAFGRLSFSLQQVLANHRLALSQPGRRAIRNALRPLQTELRRRPDVLPAVLGLISSRELRLDLLRLLGIDQPQRRLASLMRRRGQAVLPGRGTEAEPFRVSRDLLSSSRTEPAEPAVRSPMPRQSFTPGNTAAGSGPRRIGPLTAPAPSGPVQQTTNHFGGVTINVRGAAELGGIVRELQLRGMTGRLRRGG